MELINSKTIEKNGVKVVIINSDTILITNAQTTLDLMMTIRYDKDCDGIAINKESICEDFFILNTGIAGDVIQKFVNYGLKYAIIGDFSSYNSKSLNYFIYECNNGNNTFFISSEDEAIEKLVIAIDLEQRNSRIVRQGKK